MPDTSQSSFLVVVRDEADGTKGLRDRVTTKVGELSTSAVGASLRGLCAQLEDVFDNVKDTGGRLTLDSMSVTVEVTASGGVQLIGTVQAQVQGGITLTFSAR